MKYLARRAVASLLCAALLAAQWPMPAEAAPEVEAPNPAEALKYLQQLGVYKDESDPLKTYLGSEERLTTIGRTMYLTLKRRYSDNQACEKGAEACSREAREEVESLQPVFKRLRDLGEYNQTRQDAAARALRLFEKKFGDLSAEAGDIEKSFRLGAQREALMTGAEIADPAEGSSHIQVDKKDHYEFRDKDGLLASMTKDEDPKKDQIVIFNRELRDKQKEMNLNRPPQVAFIPETGRYNVQMFQYSYWNLKNQERESSEALRLERMIAIAELLGKQYTLDMFSNEAGLEEDLIRQAKAKTYRHQDTTYSVFDIVEAKLTSRRAYIARAVKAVAQYQADMNRFMSGRTITNEQVETLDLDGKAAKRWLILTLIEAQMLQAKNNSAQLDPVTHEGKALKKSIEDSDLTEARKTAYWKQGVGLKNKWDEVSRILEKIRNVLLQTHYTDSFNDVQAALASIQKELGELSGDYSIYMEILSTAFRAKSQVVQSYNGWLRPDKHLYNGISRGCRGLYQLTSWSKQNSADMETLVGDTARPGVAKTYTDVAVLIAKGERADWAQARAKVMEMNPSVPYAISGESKMNDATRIALSLGANRELIESVAQTNQTLDAAAMFLTWTVGVALLAPFTRASLNGAGKLSAPGHAWIDYGVKKGGILGRGSRFMGRSLVIGGETAKHMAAHLKTLEPGEAWVNSKAGDSLIKRSAFKIGARSVNVAHRQVVFTATMGGISGAYTSGMHLVDMATQRTHGVNILGWQAIEPGHTTFSEDGEGLWKSFTEGAKGGAFWANEYIDFKFFKIPTAALGFVGIPHTAFTGTRWAANTEIIGTHGVFGSLIEKAKTTFMNPAARELAAAEGKLGLLETMSNASNLTGLPFTAFSLSTVDNVLKYSLFSSVAGRIGEEYGWRLRTSPIGNQEYEEATIDVAERRIKHSKVIGEGWLESPLWMLIPSYAAHSMAEAAPYMRAREGALQYEKAGRTDHLLKANNELVDFIEPLKPPLSQKIFEANYFMDAPPTQWAMTEPIRRAGQRKAMIRMLAGPEGKIKDISPLEFHRISKLAENTRYIDFTITGEVQLVAHQNFVTSLLSRPEWTREALKGGTIKTGNSVERITPEMQLDIAVALNTAEAMGYRKPPADILAVANNLLVPYLKSGEIVPPYANALLQAINSAPVKSPNLDSHLSDIALLAREWLEGKGQFAGKHYDELIAFLYQRADAALKSKKLLPAEHDVLRRIYDYVMATELRFNSFNNVESVSKRSGVTNADLHREFSQRAEVIKLLDSFQHKMDGWSKGRTGPVLGPKAAGKSYAELIETCVAELKSAEARLLPNEVSALNAAIKDMESAPWVLRDKMGTALYQWQPEQFVSFMEALGSMAHGESNVGAGGRGGAPIRLFQELTTGGGKTMLVLVGLLPLVEADAVMSAKANVLGKKTPRSITFLTTQSNLEAQAKMDFFAYRLIGSKLTFDTFGNFKSKIAEGKMKGENVVERHWILGDEMDASALEAATTIGQTAGSISRRNSAAKRIEEIDRALARQFESGRLERAANILTEARRLSAASKDPATVPGPKGEVPAILAKAERLEQTTSLFFNRKDDGKIARNDVPTDLSILADIVSLRERIDALGAGDFHAVAKARRALLALEKIHDIGPREFKNTRPETPVEAPSAMMTAAARLEAAAEKLAQARGRVEARAAEAAVKKLAIRMRELIGELPPSESGIIQTANESLARLESARLGRPDALKANKDALVKLKEGLKQQELLLSFFLKQGNLARLSQEVRASREALDVRIGRLERESRKQPGVERTSALREELALARQERDVVALFEKKLGESALEGNANALIAGFGDAGAAILEIAKKGDFGWENTALRLLERRRALLEVFTAGENPLYGVYGNMKERAWSIAHSEILLKGADLLKNSVSDLQLTVEQLAAFEKNPQGAPSEAMPFLAEMAKSAPEIGARVRTLEAQLKEAEARPGSGRTLLALSRARLERARIEFELVERFQALGSASAPKAGPLEVDAIFARLKQIDIEAEHVTAGSAAKLNRSVDGDGFLKFMPRFIANKLRGEPLKLEQIEGVGLTRLYADKLRRALREDPLMPITQRDNLWWSFVNSFLFPKGIGHAEKGSSWVRSEIQNLVHGYHANPAGVRFDGPSGKLNVVHNGQRFESMDNASRRWWELEYGADLTLPYTHQAISTIKDVTTFKSGRFFSVSGTSGALFKEHMVKEAGARISGVGSKTPEEGVVLKVVSGPGEQLSAIRSARNSGLDSSKDHVVLHAADMEGLSAGVKKAINDHLKEKNLQLDKNPVIKISDIGLSAAKAQLKKLRAKQKQDGHLLVLGVSDTRALRTTLKYLKHIGIADEEIAKVFSDSEYLRTNTPKAKVAKQMNLEALNSGKVKVLVLDWSVGGRGLDLNFKGDRANLSAEAFRGYTTIDMLALNPQAISDVHFLQIAGRISKGRILPGTQRSFSTVMNAQTIQSDPLFRRMVAADPFFVEMRKDPAVQAYALAKGERTVDLPMIDAYISSREKGERKDDLTKRYHEALEGPLKKRQEQIALEQFQSSQVIEYSNRANDTPPADKYPNIKLIR